MKVVLLLLLILFTILFVITFLNKKLENFYAHTTIEMGESGVKNYFITNDHNHDELITYDNTCLKNGQNNFLNPKVSHILENFTQNEEIDNCSPENVWNEYDKTVAQNSVVPYSSFKNKLKSNNFLHKDTYYGCANFPDVKSLAICVDYHNKRQHFRLKEIEERLDKIDTAICNHVNSGRDNEICEDPNFISKNFESNLNIVNQIDDPHNKYLTRDIHKSLNHSQELNVNCAKKSDFENHIDNYNQHTNNSINAHEIDSILSSYPTDAFNNNNIPNMNKLIETVNTDNSNLGELMKNFNLHNNDNLAHGHNIELYDLQNTNIHSKIYNTLSNQIFENKKNITNHINDNVSGDSADDDTHGFHHYITTKHNDDYKKHLASYPHSSPQTPV